MTLPSPVTAATPSSPPLTRTPVPAQPPTSTMLLLLMAASIGSSVSLILAMKVVMQTLQFRFVATLSACHFATTALFSRVAASYGLFQPRRAAIPRGDVLRMAAAGTASIVFMNANLHANSVGTYQMSKLMCIPYMIMQARLVRHQRVSLEMTVALVCILAGVAAATVTDVQLTVWGSVVAAAAVAGTAQFQLWQGSKQAEYGLSAMQITDIVMPWQCLVCSLAALLVDGVSWSGQAAVSDGLSKPPVPATLWEVTWSAPLLWQIGYTCVLAVAVNIVTYALIGKTSAVTFQVVGHLKTILTLAGGYYLFDSAAATDGSDHDGWGVHAMGMVVALVGMALYGDIKNQQQKAASTADVNTVKTGSALSRIFPGVRWSREY